MKWSVMLIVRAIRRWGFIRVLWGGAAGLLLLMLGPRACSSANHTDLITLMTRSARRSDSPGKGAQPGESA